MKEHISDPQLAYRMLSSAHKYRFLLANVAGQGPALVLQLGTPNQNSLHEIAKGV